MILIKVSYVGMLKIDVENDSMVEVEDGMTVREFLLRHGVQREHLGFIKPIVNGERVRVTEALHEGDELKLFLPVGGG